MTVKIGLCVLVALVLPCAAAGAQDADAYLEIPIVGSFGKEVTAPGIEAALTHAKEKGIKNVVLVVDSKGGRQTVGRDVNIALRKFDKAFKYHSVVTQATGVALVAVVWCDTIWVKPGAQIGGLNIVVDESLGVEPSVVLMNVALNAGDRAKEHGHSPELFRAMIDPSEPVYAWKDASGKPAFGRSLPVDISKDSILLEHADGKILTLTDKQAVALGFARALEGGVDGIGKALGLAGWKSAGDEGKKSMVGATVAEERKVNEAKSDREKFLIEQNLKRREAAKASTEKFLELANQWNPKAGTYSTYKDGGWDGFWGGDGYDTGRLTPEAKRKWRDRTDITVSSLVKARQGVIELKALEKEAATMKQAPVFPEGKLDAMLQDLNLKIEMLGRERDKRYLDDRKPQ
jgi:hypothetical protein